MHAIAVGGPAPRMADGHVDLTGRWYPNAAGRMLQVAYPVDPAAFLQFDPKVTPEAPPSFKPGVEAKYTRPKSRIRRMRSGRHSHHDVGAGRQHAPMELIETPGKAGHAVRISVGRSHGLHESRSIPRIPIPRSMATRPLIGREIRWCST